MKYEVKINDTVYEVEVIKGKAQLLSEYKAINAVTATEASAPAEATAATSAPQAGAPAADAKSVTAPLPGQVVAIKVAVGQKVKVGDVVAIIEAMKMENDVTSSVDGTVSQIVAQKGSQINASSPIIILA